MLRQPIRPIAIVPGLLMTLASSCELAAQTASSSMSSEAAAPQEIQAPRKPRTNGKFPARVASQLRSAFPLAVKRVRKVPSCRALFDELGADGVERLAATQYRAPTAQEETFPRVRSARAFTCVGSARTMLCQGFGQLPLRTAAATLIHEALHFAGLSERPVDPEGMTDDEIHRMVALACRL